MSYMETQGKAVNQADKCGNVITEADILMVFVLTSYRQRTDFRFSEVIGCGV